MSVTITPLAGALILGLFTSATITPPSGELTTTGVAPTASVEGPSQTASPAVGSLAIAGYAPTVYIASETKITPSTGHLFFGVGETYSLTPPSGTLSFVGSAPSAVVEGADQVVTPSVGALGLTGVAPSAIQSTLITPPTGALVMEPPTLEWTWTQTDGEDLTFWRFKYGRDSGVYTNYTDVEDETLREIPVRAVIDAGPGWWYIRAYAYGPSGEGSFSNELYVNPGIVTLQLDTPRIPPSGSLTVTGAAPNLVTGSQTSITPDTGALVTSGSVPTLFRQDSRTPPSGSLALSGTVPTLIAPLEIVPPTGAMAVSGVAPLVGSDRTIVPPAGALTITGVAPTVDQSTFLTRLITPPVGSAILAGVAPVLRTDTRLTPPTGSLGAAGAAPSLLTPQVVTPPTGAAVLTGSDPLTIIGPVIIPPTGALAVTGASPTLDATVHVTITPPSGAMDVTAETPTVLQTGLIFEAYRLRELPPRYALVERAERYRLRELPPRYAFIETDRGVE